MKVVKTPKRYEKLRQFVKSKGMTLKDFAIDVLGKTPQTLDYKYRGISKFTSSEIEIVKKHFNLTNKQVVDFFFTD